MVVELPQAGEEGGQEKRRHHIAALLLRWYGMLEQQVGDLPLAGTVGKLQGQLRVLLFRRGAAGSGGHSAAIELRCRLRLPSTANQVAHDLQRRRVLRGQRQRGAAAGFGLLPLTSHAEEVCFPEESV